MIRPIGKNTKFAGFEKETTEGIYVNPTKEIPFKSCDVKKTMKTEEDTSNIGEIFTTDLVTMGYDVTGNVEMNVYPETIGDLFFFTLGKSTKGDLYKGAIIFHYIGPKKYARYKIGSGENLPRSLIIEVSDNDNLYTTLKSVALDGTPLENIVQSLTHDHLNVSYVGSGRGDDIPNQNETYLKKEDTAVTGIVFAKKTYTNAKGHNIYSSNSSLDSIPSFSALLDKGFGVGKCFGYAGCKINTFSLSLAVKTFVTSSISLRAKDELENKTDTSNDFEMTAPYLTNNAKIFINGTEFNEIKDLKLDINNNMYIDEAVGVNTYNSQDRQGATINISGTANLTVSNAQNATIRLNESYIQNKSISMILYLESPTKVADNETYKAFIFIPQIKLSDGTVSVGGAERLTLTFAGQAIKSFYGRHIDVFINSKKTTDF